MNCFRKYLLILVLLFTALILSGCIIVNDDSPDKGQDPEYYQKEPVADINNVRISDKDSVYSFDDDESVITMYLTVRKGNRADGTDHLWSDICSYSIFDYDTMGVERYKAASILQVGDENGPLQSEFGYNETEINSFVQIRGNTTSTMPQKSYKIKILSNKGMWRQQRTIALNKHIFDCTRFMNKMTYDIIKDIPDMIGVRTQFVHLYVKDETGSGGESPLFVDYGLYTQVEQPNTRYLRNHGFDVNGQLYKAEMCEMYRYADSLKLIDDPDYDEEAFEDVLEIKGSTNHTKLLNMLDDLNDYSIDIETVFNKYFDEDNFFTWLAFHILLSNIDTTSRNFYIYSPYNSSKFYFITWDNDGAFLDITEEAQHIVSDFGYEMGISNYWSNILCKRTLSVEKYRKILDNKIEYLRSILTPSYIEALAIKYAGIVKPYVYSMPDIMNARVDISEYDAMVFSLKDQIELSYNKYLESLKKPMPFYLSPPFITDEGLKFEWDASFDFNNENIVYTFELCRDYLFTDCLIKQDGLVFPYTYIEDLPEGQYFYRVTATNVSGEFQKAFDYYVDINSFKYYGILEFWR